MAMTRSFFKPTGIGYVAVNEPPRSESFFVTNVPFIPSVPFLPIRTSNNWWDGKLAICTVTVRPGVTPTMVMAGIVPGANVGCAVACGWLVGASVVVAAGMA